MSMATWVEPPDLRRTSGFDGRRARERAAIAELKAAKRAQLFEEAAARTAAQAEKARRAERREEQRARQAAVGEAATLGAHRKAEQGRIAAYLGSLEASLARQREHRRAPLLPPLPPSAERPGSGLVLHRAPHGTAVRFSSQGVSACG
jgi:hypothetical protein